MQHQVRDILIRAIVCIDGIYSKSSSIIVLAHPVIRQMLWEDEEKKAFSIISEWKASISPVHCAASGRRWTWVFSRGQKSMPFIYKECPRHQRRLQFFILVWLQHLDLRLQKGKKQNAVGKKRPFQRRLSMKDTAIFIGISQGLLSYSFAIFFSEARLQFGRVVKPQISIGWIICTCAGGKKYLSPNVKGPHKITNLFIYYLSFDCYSFDFISARPGSVFLPM